MPVEKQMEVQVDADLSAEDYSNAAPYDETNKTPTTSYLKNEGTMPESPTSSASVSGPNTEGASDRKRCSSTAISIILLIAALLVATGVGLAVVFVAGDGIDARTDASLLLDAPGGASPSAAPSTPFPSMEPSSAPSMEPSAEPSLDPSQAPTEVPSVAPSDNPSVDPTIAPTPSPTEVYYPQNDEPRSPPRGYFNYDPDSSYGPNSWHRVDTSQHWLREFSPDGFGAWDDFHPGNLTENQCGGRTRKQSPKDLVSTEPCEAEHEIRTECAQYPLSSDEFMDKQILPHKLSIVFKRRECLDLENQDCLDDRPPMADYPRFASGDLNIEAYSDLHHFDIKVPGEHTIDGETFDAEIQMFHTSLTAPRLSSLGVPIRADDGLDNPEYQTVLNEFQSIYDLNALQCDRRERQLQLRGSRNANTASTDQELAYLTDAIQNLTETRKLQRNPNFNPYSDYFLPTMFFFRYDGSITEPPCMDLTWWVMDEPMRISRRQLSQTKRILFSHVDANCNPTSVHNADQSVTRPIEALGEDREIQHCQTGDFRSDVSKGRPPAKRCRGFE